jgi:tetratricopeptide (TPR) repeat protein
MRCHQAGFTVKLCLLLTAGAGALLASQFLRAAGSEAPLFHTFPITTKSPEARKLLETAIFQYENALANEAMANARAATQKDPEFALAYAVLSFIARRQEPLPEALRKAKELAPKASADEQILIRWLTGLQEGDILPAIAAMNDLLARYPKEPHIVYLAGEWLYFQQSFDRSKELLKEVISQDPDFPAALNMLGYTYVSEGHPEEAVAAMKHYVAVLPNQPNPEDSFGEISRYAGDDAGSLEHYGHALAIDPHFYTSQVGLGDTSAMMGNFGRAQEEYDKALKLTDAPRELGHIRLQKALVLYREGKHADCDKELAALEQNSKDAYALAEIKLTRALLADSSRAELPLLDRAAAFLGRPQHEMTEADRRVQLSAVLSEHVRVLSAAGDSTGAAAVARHLQAMAERHRDQAIEANSHTAQGYVLFVRGKFADAAQEFSNNPQSPLAVRQQALALEKSGKAAAASAVRNRLRFLRAPTAEWLVATRPSS